MTGEPLVECWDATLADDDRAGSIGHLLARYRADDLPLAGHAAKD